MSNKKLEHTIVNFLNKIPNQNFTLGLSGGVDSIVIFHVLVKYKFKFNAIYVHHGLSENADKWLNFCKKLCEDYSIDFLSEKVNIQHKNRKSLEEEARTLRYQAYSKVSNQFNSTIILGHHNDDLVESMLLNLLNRSGLKGLSAMPNHYFNEEFNIYIARPFLGDENLPISKDMIEQYAKDNNINHIYDESNEDNSFSRNFLRNEIIPKLKDHFGNIGKPMAKTNKEAQNLHSLIVENDLFVETKKNLNMYEIDTKQEIQWHDFVFSLEKHFKFKVKKVVADKAINWLTNRKINEMSIDFGGFTIFYHKDKFYIIDNKTLKNLNLKSFSSPYMSKIDAISLNKEYRKEINKAFKQNDYIRKNIPSIFRDSAIYLLDSNNLIMIGNFDIKNRIIEENTTTGNSYVDYFLIR